MINRAQNQFLLCIMMASFVHAYDATVYWNYVKQTIRGFGACASYNIPQSMAEPDRSNSVAALFDTVTGAGLSMVRLEIRSEFEPSPGSWNWAGTPGEIRQRWLVDEAKKKGVAFFWSAPWSPPAWMKSSNSTKGNAYLLASHYQDFADYLSAYVREYKSRFGITISGISVQNEPHFASPWDGCPYSGTQLRDIIKNNIGPTFKRDGVTAMIIAPESNWHQREWADPIFSDTAASRYTSVAAFHEYETGLTTPYPLAQNQGKELWQSEVCNMGGDNPGIGDAIGWAKLIHGHLTQAQVNAWHYWWLYCSPTSGQGLINTANSSYTTTKRLWAMGNWSKFVRPGWKMIRATYLSPDGIIAISAFKHEASGKFAIVAMNSGTSGTKDVNIIFNGFSSSLVTPWLTDGTNNLKAQTPITVSGGKFSVTLQGWSIATYVGTTSAVSIHSFSGEAPHSSKASIASQVSHIV